MPPMKPVVIGLQAIGRHYMTDEAKMDVVRRYFTELWNRGNLALADELIAPGFGGADGVVSGPEAAKMYVSSYRSAFPNIHFCVLNLRCEGEMVAACWVGTGAHEPAEGCADGIVTGKERTITGMSVYRIEDGRIAEMWIGSEATQQLADNKGLSAYNRN